MTLEEGIGGELAAHILRRAALSPPDDRAAIGRAAARLGIFLAFLVERNAAMNLVSERSSRPEVLVERHLFDSLFGLSLLPPAASRPLRLVDIGSGGGFPAIPLLLLRPDLDGTLVESTRKKAVFLGEVIERLALTARVVTARFPDSLFMKNAAAFDVLTTRAVAGAGTLVRQARAVLSPEARALLWTSEPLVGDAVRESGASRSLFHRAPGADRSGILALECFT